jgi:hypothetical protein
MSSFAFKKCLLSNPPPPLATNKPLSRCPSQAQQSRAPVIEFHLARVYREMGEHDAVLSVLMGSAEQQPTKDALEMAFAGDWRGALGVYDSALRQLDEGTLSAPAHEEELWEEHRMECMREILDWSNLHRNVMLQADEALDTVLRPDFDTHNAGYLSYFISSSLLDSACSPSLGDLVAEAQLNLSRGARDRLNIDDLAERFAVELSLQASLQGDYPLTRLHTQRAHQAFLSTWRSTLPVNTAPRVQLLQSLQLLTEAREFADVAARLEAVGAASPVQELQAASAALLTLLQAWQLRKPSTSVAPVQWWHLHFTVRQAWLSSLAASAAKAMEADYPGASLVSSLTSDTAVSFSRVLEGCNLGALAVSALRNTRKSELWELLFILCCLLREQLVSHLANFLIPIITFYDRTQVTSWPLVIKPQLRWLSGGSSWAGCASCRNTAARR